MITAEQFNEFVAWSKRRGVIWPSSEIYGGIGSTYDYGPVGVEMKNRLKTLWWRTMVHYRNDVVGLDSAIILNPKVWDASGHTGEGFTDPMVEDLVTHKRYRQDQLTDPTKSPDGNPLSEPKNFNILMKTFIGPVEDTAGLAYLRGETCQGIFVDFKQVVDTSRVKLPFGIAQIGKAFRNEITPGNFTYRTREFEQMELEYFVKPEEAEEQHKLWIESRYRWYQDLGINEKSLRLYKHPKSKLAHYSKGTTDIEFQFPWGWGELEGIANRGDYDLLQHQQHSGKDMTIFDEETKKKVLPWVIEPSGGVDRALLAIMTAAWQYYPKGRNNDGEAETVLAIDPRLAAFDAAVLPLIKKEPLLKMASELVDKLRKEGKNVFYDESGSIGRRYRRQDEIGTPTCYTIDFQSLEDQTVTARNRDTMTQERVKV